MKIKSALVTQMSGSLGGMTGSHNAGGLYLRARAIPVNPNTAFQQAVRGYLTTIVAAWNDVLTPPMRAAWAAYAAAVPIPDALGDPRYIPALAHFVRSNVPRLQAGLARIDTGPIAFTLPSFTNPTLTWVAATEKMSVAFTTSDLWANEAGGAMLAFCSFPQTVGTNYFKGPYRYVGKIVGATPVPPTSPQLFDTPAPIETTQKVFGYVEIVRADGRLSGKFRAGGAPA